MSRPTTVQGYVAALPESGRERIEELRQLARRAVPYAAETLKWGSPAYVHDDGTILFVLSAHAAHANIVFTPSVKDTFAADLSRWDTGKGSVKLPYGRAVPHELLARMIAERLREHEVDGVGWR